AGVRAGAALGAFAAGAGVILPARGQDLDLLAAEALANHIQLIERGILEGDAAALRTVADLHLETEDVAELALEGFDIGGGWIDQRRGARTFRAPCPGQPFGLAHRQA